MFSMIVQSPVGLLRLIAVEDALCGVAYVGKSETDLRAQAEGAVVETAVSSPVLRAASEQLGEYFRGERHKFSLPLDLSAGTAFQQEVWRAAIEIPYGQPISYGELAVRIGRPNAARAVGGALGRNPLLIVVPCHRVVRGDGSLGGFGAGLPVKRALLELEGYQPQR